MDQRRDFLSMPSTYSFNRERHNMYHTQRFLKKSIWSFTAPTKIGDVVCGAGERFRVVYSRRRDSEDIGISLLDRHYPYKARNPRFPNCNIVIQARKLINTELVELAPDYQYDYHLRQKDTHNYLTGGVLYSSFFSSCKIYETNFCVTERNTRKQIIDLAINHKNAAKNWKIDNIPVEIVEYDPIEREINRIIPIEENWYYNIMSIRNIPKRYTTLLELAGCLPYSDDKLAGLAIFEHNSQVSNFLKHSDINYHSYRNRFVLYDKPDDLMLTKIMLGNAVEITQFG